MNRLQLLEKAIENSFDGVFIVDNKGKVLYVNAGDRVILLESDNGQGRVSVSVPTSAKVMRVTGTTVSLNSLEAGASLQIFGSYKGEQFEATMVLVK